MKRLYAMLLLYILVFSVRMESMADESISGPEVLDTAKTWWPDTDAPSEYGKRVLNKLREEQLAKHGRVSKSVSKPLEDIDRIEKLAKSDQEVLAKLHALECYPRLLLTTGEGDKLYIKSVDLSGRSGELGGSEINMQFITTIGDDVVALLSDLPKLEAVFAFGTRITDTGVETIAKLPNLKAVWLPPLATDRSVLAIAQCKRLQWLSTLGAEVTRMPFKAISALPSLQTVIVWNSDGTGIADSLATSSSLKHLIINGKNMLKRGDNP